MIHKVIVTSSSSSYFFFLSNSMTSDSASVNLEVLFLNLRLGSNLSAQGSTQVPQCGRYTPNPSAFKHTHFSSPGLAFSQMTGVPELTCGGTLSQFPSAS